MKKIAIVLGLSLLASVAWAQDDREQPAEPTLEEKVARVVEGLELSEENADLASAAFGAYDEALTIAKKDIEAAAAGYLSEDQLAEFVAGLDRRGGRGARGERAPRGERPEGERPPRGERPEGERPPRGERPEGERPEGERPPRGERPEGERRGGFGQMTPEERRARQLERFTGQLEGYGLDEAGTAGLTDAYGKLIDARSAANEQLQVDLGSFLEEDAVRQAMRLFQRGNRGRGGRGGRGERQPGANDFY